MAFSSFFTNRLVFTGGECKETVAGSFYIIPPEKSVILTSTITVRLSVIMDLSARNLLCLIRRQTE